MKFKSESLPIALEEFLQRTDISELRRCLRLMTSNELLSDQYLVNDQMALLLEIKSLLDFLKVVESLSGDD